ncbi:hypothetical protein C4J87_2420 [Pseudomonas sp. R1-43-08]|nr:hypothetical protein C4J87_2420 [Pseudomonas sp. R1-43-08]AZF53086.1 hypothetical protein C4J85_2601 [Pseudomonas sp. R4-34-07]
MQKTRRKHRGANKQYLLCAVKVRTILMKVLFNTPLLLLILIFIVRMRQ